MIEAAKLPGVVCPHCGYANHDYTGIEEPDLQAEPLDLSICFGCAQPSRFHLDADGRLTLRQMTEEEWADLPSENLQDLSRAMSVIRAYRRVKPR